MITVYSKRGNRNALERKMESDISKFVSEKLNSDKSFDFTAARNYDELKAYHTKYCTTTTSQVSIETNTMTESTSTDLPKVDNATVAPEKKVDNNISSENAEYNPLTTEPVAEKPYAKPMGAGGTDAQNAIPIAEPSFTPPKIDNAPTSTTPPLKATPLNTDMAGMTSQEKSDGAAQTADMFFAGYEQLHTFGQMYVKVTDEELMELYRKKELAPDITIVVGEGKQIYIGELFKTYNEQAKEALVVSKEWKESIRPALIRLAIKYGWVMSDEMYVGLKIAQDLATKVGIMIALKKTINGAIANFSTEYKQQQSGKREASSTDKKYSSSKKEEEPQVAEIIEDGEQ